MAKEMKFFGKTIWEEPVIMVPSEKFYDGMTLIWDDVTEIHEDEMWPLRKHYVSFDSANTTIDEMFQKMLELGIMDFGFHTILKMERLFLFFVPGGVETVESQIVPMFKKDLKEDGYPFNLMFPI